MTSTRRRRRGFTLIETVAAIVILSVGVPAMLWAIRDAHQERANPVLASRARWLAVEKLEDVIADRHSANRGYDYLVTGNYPDEANVTDFENFSRSVAFDETTADLSTAGDGYLTVTVTVEWTDTSGADRSLGIATVLTEYTP